jgi:hypothetical protein
MDGVRSHTYILETLFSRLRICCANVFFPFLDVSIAVECELLELLFCLFLKVWLRGECLFTLYFCAYSPLQTLFCVAIHVFPEPGPLGFHKENGNADGVG